MVGVSLRLALHTLAVCVVGLLWWHNVYNWVQHPPIILSINTTTICWAFVRCWLGHFSQLKAIVVKESLAIVTMTMGCQ